MDYHHGGRVASALSLRQGLGGGGGGRRVPTPGCRGSNSSSEDEMKKKMKNNSRMMNHHLAKTTSGPHQQHGKGSAVGGRGGRGGGGGEKWPLPRGFSSRGQILTGGNGGQQQLPCTGGGGGGQLLVTTQASVGSIDRLYSYLSGSEEDDDDDEEEEDEEEDDDEEEEDGGMDAKQQFVCYQPKPNRRLLRLQRSLSRGPGAGGGGGGDPLCQSVHGQWVRNPVVTQSSDSETDRDCRLIGLHPLHPPPPDAGGSGGGGGTKDGARFSDVVYSRINRNKEASAHLPMSVISLPRLDHEFGKDDLVRLDHRDGGGEMGVTGSSSSRGVMPNAQQYVNLSELRSTTEKQPSYHQSFLASTDNGSNIPVYSAVRTSANAFNRSGQSSRSVVSGRLPRTASCSRTSLHHQQHPSRSSRHASGGGGGGGASEPLCLRPDATASSAASAAAGMLRSNNNDEPLASSSRLSMEQSGLIWIQQQERTDENNQATINIEEQFYSAFNPTNVSLQPVPFMPTQTDFRCYSSLSQTHQRVKKRLKNQCTWKCIALLFVSISVALLALLSCLIVMKVHNVLWRPKSVSSIRENYSSLSEDAVHSSSSVTTITMGENHEERLRPRSFSRSQFSLRDVCFIRFNISIPSDALIGVYGSRNAHPSHVQYDFFFVFNGMELLSPHQQQQQQRQKRGKRDAANEQTMVNSAFIQFFDRGHWYLFLYNDGDQTHTVKFTATIQGSAGQLSLCPRGCYGRGDCVAGQCRCFPGFTGTDCQQGVCPRPCRGNGVYSGGECKCHSGWKGKECEVLVGVVDCGKEGTMMCGGNGDCVGGSCVCAPRYTGTNCTELCGVECLHGKCGGDQQQQRCQCDSGWSGRNCDLLSCDARCTLHGVCNNGSCVCNEGWNGKHCSLDGCPDLCSNGHGICRHQPENNAWRCSCHEGWKGVACHLAMEIDCDSNRDEDEDGLVDCLDPDCCSSASCQGGLQCRTAPDPLEILLRKQPPSTAASFYDRFKFLIEEKSVQSYATLSSFNPSQVSLIRGRVISTDRSPLIGVRVGVYAQPLYGFTFSRENGLFDILVNGGGSVTLNFQRARFDVRQVTVLVPWNRMVTMDAVTLMLENELEPSGAETCPPGTHDHYTMRPIVLSTWQHTQLTCCPSKSGIIPESKVLQEILAIPGTDVFLVYHSSHTSGYMSTIAIELTPSIVPHHLSIVHLVIAIEGIVFDRIFEAEPRLRHQFTWDRRNAYNQKVYGIVTATFEVGYEYLNCSSIYWVKKSATLSGYDISSSEIGGWNLNIHHNYNFQEGILHRGDGSNIYLKEQPWKATTILGDGKQRRVECDGCDSSAVTNRLLAPVALASGRDGSLYVGDYNFIRKVSANREEVTNILQLSMPEIPYKYFMSVSPLDGKLYISDHHGLRIIRVKTMGGVRDLNQNFEVIAGTGDQCMPGDFEKCGDGGLALVSRLHYPKGIAISKDGLIYFADGANIRTINQAGIISTLIGSQGSLRYWHPLPCHAALHLDNVTLHWPTSVSINPLDDSLHILDGGLILRLTPDDMVMIVVGRSPHCPQPNSNSTRSNIGANPANIYLAVDAILQSPQHMSFGANGDLFVIEANGKDVSRVRVVDTNGWIRHYAGARPTCDCKTPLPCQCLRPEVELSQRIRLDNPTAIAVTPDNVLHIADMGNLRIYAVSPMLPVPNKQGQFEVASINTMEQYFFNRYGQHVTTKNLITGQYIYNLTYNVNSYYAKLMKVTDASGNSIVLRRDYKLQANEMQQPGGQRSKFVMDSMGQLQAFTDSENVTTKFTYYANTGLLESKETSGGQMYLYSYNVSGQLSTVLLPTGQILDMDVVDDGELGYNDELQISYPHNGHFTIEYPFKMTSTMEISPFPLPSSPHRLIQRLQILFSGILVRAVEWHYYSHSGYDRVLSHLDWVEGHPGQLVQAMVWPTGAAGLVEDQRWRSRDRVVQDGGVDPATSWSYEGKDLVVNGDVILTFRYNHDDSSQAILNKKREEVLTVRYDSGGRVVQFLPRSPTEGVNLTFNQLGQLVQWTYGDRHVLRGYDNKTGHLVERKLANKAIYRYVYRNGNKPTDIILPSGKQFQVVYDDQGNLRTVVMPNLAKHHFYSLTTLGLQRLMYRPPDSKNLYIQDYNNKGQLETIHFPSGHRRVTYRYDRRSRLSNMFYDWTNVRYEYHGKLELLLSVTLEDLLQDYSCTLGYQWNSSLVAVQSVIFNGSLSDFVNAELMYSYESNFVVDSVKAFIGKSELPTISYVYDADTGRLEKVAQFSFDYPHAHREITGDGNVEIVREFDRFGRQTDVWYRFNNYIVFTLEMKYDNVGRVHQWRRKVRTSDLKAYEYVFDVDGNLIEVLENSQSTWKYEFDANGNVVKIGYYNNVRSIVIGLRDKVESSGEESFIYDQDGFLVKRNDEVFEFDSLGHLQRAFQPGKYDVRYFYDGLARLVGVKDAVASSAVQMFYADGVHRNRVTHAYDHSTETVTQFFYDDRGKLFAMLKDNEYFYVGLDPTDSPILIMNSVGSIVKQITYDPLGFQIGDSAPDFPFVLGFRCGIADAVTRLVFVEEDVIYDPQLGRRMIPSYGQLLRRVKDLPLYPDLANLYWHPFLWQPEVEAAPTENDISDWMLKLGYNYERLVPSLAFHGNIIIATTTTTECTQHPSSPPVDMNLMPITSAFHCAFTSDVNNFRELHLVPKSALTTTNTEEVLTVGRTFAQLQLLFGPGVVLSIVNNQVRVDVLGSASEATATLATTLFNNSLPVGHSYTIHGRHVRHFVKPSIDWVIDDMRQLWLRADDFLPGVNVTFHPVHQALDIVKFVDVRILNNHTLLNVRHGSPVDADLERVLRHAKQRAVDAAWEVERERVQSGKMSLNRWTKVQEEELVGKGRVQGMVGEYIHDVKEFPELGDSPKNVRFVPAVR